MSTALAVRAKRIWKACAAAGLAELPIDDPSHPDWIRMASIGIADQERVRIEETPCPKEGCQAEAGSPCRIGSRVKPGFHAERIRAARLQD